MSAATEVHASIIEGYAIERERRYSRPRGWGRGVLHPHGGPNQQRMLLVPQAVVWS